MFSQSPSRLLAATTTVQGTLRIQTTRRHCRRPGSRTIRPRCLLAPVSTSPPRKLYIRSPEAEKTYFPASCTMGVISPQRHPRRCLGRVFPKPTHPTRICTVAAAPGDVVGMSMSATWAHHPLGASKHGLAPLARVVIPQRRSERRKMSLSSYVHEHGICSTRSHNESRLRPFWRLSDALSGGIISRIDRFGCSEFGNGLPCLCGHSLVSFSLLLDSLFGYFAISYCSKIQPFARLSYTTLFSPYEARAHLISDLTYITLKSAGNLIGAR
jgi:hypothetical protein